MIKKAIILIILLIAGGAVFYVFQEGKKMAAVVGTEIISSARLDKNFRAALRYYEIADQTYRVENVDFASESFLRELRRSVLESLIINAVISEELGGIYGEELARRVKEKIDPIKTTSKRSRPLPSCTAWTARPLWKKFSAPRRGGNCWKSILPRKSWTSIRGWKIG